MHYKYLITFAPGRESKFPVKFELILCLVVQSILPSCKASIQDFLSIDQNPILDSALKRSLVDDVLSTLDCVQINLNKNFTNDIFLKSLMDKAIALILNNNFLNLEKSCKNHLFIFNSSQYFYDKNLQMFNTIPYTHWSKIIIFDQSDENSVQYLRKSSHYFQYFNVLYFSTFSKSIYALSSPLFLNRTFEQISIIELDKWVYKPYQTPDLKGRTVNAVTFHCPFYTVINTSVDIDSDRYDGLEMKIFMEVAKVLNFMYKFKELSDIDKWGQRLSNGTYVGGIMAELTHGNSEVGFCSIWVSYYQSLVIDYTVTWGKTATGFLVPRPKLIGSTWVNALKPFSLQLWLAVLVALSLTPALLWNMNKLYFYKKRLTCANPGNLTLFTSYLYAFGAFTSASSEISTIKKESSRHIISWWYIFCLIITTAYSSKIVAQLTFPMYTNRIDTIQQLVEGGFIWGKMYKEDDLSKHLNFYDEWNKQFASRFQLYNASMIRQLIQSDTFAVYAQTLGEDNIYLDTDNLDPDIISGLRVMKEKTRYYSIAIALRKNSPLIFGFNKIITRLLESGIIDFWKKDAGRRLGKPGYNQMFLNNEESNHGEILALTLDNFQGAFYTLILGHILASLTFIIEYLNLCLPKKINFHQWICPTHLLTLVESESYEDSPMYE